ncbi:MAG TPA: DUF6445 family protein [Pyrinomonadaceae bacterium]|nr:DUF6445 family protein [Pyrinomonadaceae bacterium]
MLKRFLNVVEDFYPDPEAVRRKAYEMSYGEPEKFTGWRTRAFQPRGVRERIERSFRVRIKFWETDLNAVQACNGVFFLSYSAGERAERVGVHYDLPLEWAMLIVYLTPGAPADAGTSLWQHRSTGLTTKPTARDAQRLGTTVERLNAVLWRDRYRHERWREIDRVGNVYNRAVMFSAGFFHSATRHFGSDLKHGRIYQTFHFPIDWKASGRNDER